MMSLYFSTKMTLSGIVQAEVYFSWAWTRARARASGWDSAPKHQDKNLRHSWE